MSFSPPSAPVITLDSGDIVLKSGTFRLKMYIKTIVGFQNSYSLNVESLEGYEVDMDLEAVGATSDYAINLPEFTFTVRDKISDGTNTDNLLELIDNLNVNELIVCEITFGSGADLFYTTKDQAEFSYKDRNLKFKAQHPLKYGQLSYNKTFDLTSVREDASISVVSDCVQVYNYIEEFLKVLGNSVTPYIDSKLYFNKTSPVNLDHTIAIPLGTVTPSIDASTSIIRSIAISEGAIIGNILGNAYFVNRASKGNSVSMTASDFEDFNVEINHKNIRNFDINLSFNPSADGIFDSSVFNDQGKNDVDVTFTTQAGYYVQWNASNSRWEQPTDDIDNYLNLTTGIGTNPSRSSYVITAYKKSLGASDDVFISGKINGITTVRPDQYMSMDGSIHPLVTGKDYRFSYMKFDLVEDSIEFEAYEI